MPIGILLADDLPAPLIPRFGPFERIFAQLFEPEFETVIYRIDEGRFPPAVAECDAWVVSGSAAGVYDPHDWIIRLRRFLLDVRGHRPLVGVCFGHQVIADTFGGKAEKWPAGWGAGFHRYEMVAAEGPLVLGQQLRVAVSHQDQVTRMPPGARLVARSDFTPYAMLRYDKDRALTVQCHPEGFSEMSAACIELRRGSRWTEAEADALLESTAQPLDHTVIRAWIGGFLRSEITN